MRKFIPPIPIWVLLIFLASSQSFALDSLNQEQVFIRSLVVNGSGCRLSNTKVHLAPDRKSFSLSFSDYLAEIYPNSDRLLARKSCQVTIDLQVPYGYQYSVAHFEYRGFLDLDRGVDAVHESLYYFQGDDSNSQIQKIESGPLTQHFLYRQSVDLNSTVWSPCGANRALNIKNSIFLQRNDQGGPGASGIIGADSLDGQIRHVVGLHWRRC